MAWEGHYLLEQGREGRGSQSRAGAEGEGIGFGLSTLLNHEGYSFESLTLFHQKNKRFWF